MSIAVKNIGKRFGNFVALDNVSLDFPTGELTHCWAPPAAVKQHCYASSLGWSNPTKVKSFWMVRMHPNETYVNAKWVSFFSITLYSGT